MPSDLSERLAKARAELNVSMTVMADIAGVNRRTWVNYENGSRVPDAQLLARLLENGGINPIWLMTGRGKIRLLASEQDEAHAFLDGAPTGQETARIIDEALLRKVIADAYEYFDKRNLQLSGEKFAEFCMLAYTLEKTDPVEGHEKAMKLFSLAA